ncbi:MAG: sigma-54 dependent transcriptional regulator [Blastocatellia bacterium]|nr:sigma-54 dependent transcriptional regulator [Blastocatellia bacterium]
MEKLKSRLLVVEDEAPQRKIIADILIKEGFTVQEAPDGEAALTALETSPPDLILCDWRMPRMTGGELLTEVRKREFPCAFIIMTAYGSISHAVEAIRLGADDYLTKPFERDALLIAVRRVLRTRQLEHENLRLKEEIADRDQLGELVGRAESMQRLYRTLKKIAATDATVLINGESGTGKELVARTLHLESGRAKGPFVAVNCAAIPETLMESELFGYEKGAFTGANQRRVGKFEEAQGGTLFLDEIPSMPLPLQAALLRVLQERRFTRLGGRGEVECDVRIVAASNRDLGKLVSEGAFREDLFYRLNVVPVQIPALRDRREDVPLLAQEFLKRFSAKYGISIEPLPPNVLRCLMEYSWPGNVRELSNVIERLVLLADEGSVTLADLPPEIARPTATPGCPFRLPAMGIQWESMEEGLLKQALELAGGNRTNAAKLLGMSYKTFMYRLEKFSL